MSYQKGEKRPDSGQKGVVAQSVEPWTWPWGRVVRGFESHRLHKKVPFFFMGISPHHANGSTVSFSYPIQYFGGGASGCGKTVFTEKLLLENADLFETPPTQVHYCYGAWQDRFRGMQDRGVVFHEGIPDHDALVQWFPPGRKGCWSWMI